MTGKSRTTIVPIALAVGAAYLAMLLHVLAAEPMPPIAIGASLVLGALLSALTAIDFQTYRLPNVLTLPMIGLGLLTIGLIAPDSVVWHLAGAVAGYLFLFLAAVGYRAVRGVDGVGLGDAKLLAGAGAWLGLGALPGVLLVGSVLALVQVLIVALVRRQLASHMRIPFGPSLALATWIFWLYGPLSPV
jgi:leader peptidase (prepilin peptidase)/N-methyltransferase